MNLTASELRQVLDYDSESGELRWRVARSRMVKVGAVAGCVHKHGYRVVRIGKRQYKAHRLAWLHLYGEWPSGQIDHIDGNRTNNAAANMRLATNAQNQANRGANKNNTSGRKGVSWHKLYGKWQVDIKADGKRRCLGFFDDIEEAAQAYATAATRLHGEFARF